jgi:hypothetical protein
MMSTSSAIFLWFDCDWTSLFLREDIWAAQTDMGPVLGKRFPQMMLRGHSGSPKLDFCDLDGWRKSNLLKTFKIRDSQEFHNLQQPYLRSQQLSRYQKYFFLIWAIYDGSPHSCCSVHTSNFTPKSCPAQSLSKLPSVSLQFGSFALSAFVNPTAHRADFQRREILRINLFKIYQLRSFRQCSKGWIIIVARFDLWGMISQGCSICNMKLLASRFYDSQPKNVCH